MADRIDEVLGSEPLTVAAIVARLNEDADEEHGRVKADSVRAALRRGLRAKPQRYRTMGTGDQATWCAA